jgi:LysR family glycine cleavage system transcriptional activator
MARVLPPLNALRAFEAAGRHQSFSGAAEELSVSHSAISRHVRGLEARLGVQLFREASRGVALTEDGMRYLERITPALDLIGSATESLADAPQGRVTLNSEPLFAAKVVMPRLAAFHAAYPEIDLRIEGSNMVADLERYEADLAIRFTMSGTLDLPSDLLSDAPLYPYAAPGVLKDDMLRPEDLQRHRLYRDRGPDVWTNWCAAAGFDPGLVPPSHWRLRAPLALAAALNGVGLYIGSSDCAAPDVGAGRLVQLSGIGIRHGAFYLVAAGPASRRKAVRVVRRWLLDGCAPLRRGENQPFG